MGRQYPQRGKVGSAPNLRPVFENGRWGKSLLPPPEGTNCSRCSFCRFSPHSLFFSTLSFTILRLVVRRPSMFVSIFVLVSFFYSFQFCAFLCFWMLRCHGGAEVRVGGAEWVQEIDKKKDEKRKRPTKGEIKERLGGGCALREPRSI